MICLVCNGWMLDHGLGWKRCITCASCVKIAVEGRHCVDCNLKTECCRNEKPDTTDIKRE